MNHSLTFRYLPLHVVLYERININIDIIPIFFFYSAAIKYVIKYEATFEVSRSTIASFDQLDVAVPLDHRIQ